MFFSQGLFFLFKIISLVLSKIPALFKVAYNTFTISTGYLHFLIAAMSEYPHFLNSY
jgi:hypothetical protein